VVTHSAVIAEFLRQITGAEAFAFLHNTNGFAQPGDPDAPDGRWILSLFNDTSQRACAEVIHPP